MADSLACHAGDIVLLRAEIVGGSRKSRNLESEVRAEADIQQHCH
jgi:hypothetical protein